MGSSLSLKAFSKSDSFHVPDWQEYIKIAESKGYKVYKDCRKGYNLNIVGWRNKSKFVDKFNDALAIYWAADEDKWFSFSWPITTLPGIKYLLNPLNIKGTAILAPGQYEDTYQIGLFKGYYALKQVRPVSVYRDKNRSLSIELDSATIERGNFGIHIHKAGFWNSLVGGSSAGCQVFQKATHYEHFMDFCRASAKSWGNNFTYTLIEI